MKNFVFVSGNLGKVKALEKFLGQPVEHHKVDLPEIQSLDPSEVVEHKAREAYKILNKPVLIEDTGLRFEALGRLPGTYVKFFLEEIGTEGLCTIMQPYSNRNATSVVTYAFYDGSDLQIFMAEVDGTVPDKPKGTFGMGWDPVFIPSGNTKTYAEMDETELAKFSVRHKAVKQLKKFLEQ